MAVARRNCIMVDLGAPADITALEATLAAAIAALAADFWPEDLEVMNLDETGGGLKQTVLLGTSKDPYQNWGDVTECVIKAVNLSDNASVATVNTEIAALIETQETAGRSLRWMKHRNVQVNCIPTDVLFLLFTDGTAPKAATAGGINAEKRELQITHADLTDADNGDPQTINLGAVLPADAVVFAHQRKVDTLFSGGGATAVKLDIGGTDPDAIVTQQDVFTGAATGVISFGDEGVAPMGKYGGQQLKATFTPDVGHSLADLDAGDLTITLWYFVLA